MSAMRADRVRRASRSLGSAGLSLVLGLLPAATTHAQNPIASENALPGTDDWLITNVATEVDFGNLPVPGATTSSIAEVEGYASETSVNAGGPIAFHVHSTATTVELRFFRLGWYGGLGGREVAAAAVIPATAQPPCAHFEPTHRIECDWSVSYTLPIPASWVSGVYLVKVTAQPGGKQAWIPFIVRNDARVSTYVMQLGVTTWQAYNSWGGFALYPFVTSLHPRPAADEVSFDRPYTLLGGAAGTSLLFAWEIHMLRFLEREGRDVAYLTSVDLHARPELLAGRAAFLSVGHDEYWTNEMRDHVEAARNACTDLGFFSGNAAFWQMRFAKNTTSGALNRRIIAYKEDAFERDPFALDADPANDRRVTHQFREPRIGRPEASLLGVMYAFWPATANMIVQNTGHPEYGWVFAGSGLSDGSVIPDIVGYEADRIWDSSPPGVVALGVSPLAAPEDHWDYYCTPEGCISNATIYRTPGDAYVFAAGSIQWSWRLDDLLVPGASGLRPDRYFAVEQITRNLLDRFRDSPCVATPGWAPPSLPPVFAFTLPTPVPDLTFVVDRCAGPSCLRVERALGPKFTVLLLGNSDFADPSPGPPPQLPPPPGFVRVGDLFDVSLVGQTPVSGPLLVQLGYDEQLVPPSLESELELLHYTGSGQSASWKVTQSVRDPSQNAVRAQVASLSPFALALPDGDGDAIANGVDNCPNASNEDQADFGGVEPAGPDGIGDVCQCGDVDDDRVVRAADRKHLREQLAGILPAVNAPAKCSVVQPEACSIVDAAVLARALAGYPPAPAQVCAAALAGSP